MKRYSWANFTLKLKEDKSIKDYLAVKKLKKMRLKRGVK